MVLLVAAGLSPRTNKKHTWDSFFLLQAQQKKQEQELMTLQQDHHNIHRNSKKLTVCRMNQDVGV